MIAKEGLVGIPDVGDKLLLVPAVGAFRLEPVDAADVDIDISKLQQDL